MEIKLSALEEVNKAKRLPHVGKETAGEFEAFIDKETNLLRANNIKHHLCAYFLPVHLPTRSVFLVHHKKARQWIPPGGHIDPDESPVDTVRREYFEELAWKLSDEPVILTDLTVTHIDTPTHPCKTHYDFWYRVDMDEKTGFTIDRGEFYDAAWLPLEDALQRMITPFCRRAVSDAFRV